MVQGIGNRSCAVGVIQGKRDGQARSLGVGFDVERASEFTDALAHAGDANADFAFAIEELLQGVGRDAMTEVLDFHLNAMWIEGEAYFRPGA